MHLVEHLSYSSISLLQTCGRAWANRYAYGKRGDKASWNLVFGSAWHETIEHTIEGIARGANKKKLVNGMPDTFKKKLIAQVGDQKVDWDGMTYEDGLELGTAMAAEPTVKNFVRRYKPLLARDGSPAIEFKFKMQVPGVPVPVIGFIDLINEDGVPCDLKTAGKRWGQWKADKELQATIYLEAMRQMGAKKNKELAFEYVVFVKKVPTPVERIITFRTSTQLVQAKMMVKSLWHDMIEKKAFPQTGIGTWKCDPKYCDYYNDCFGGEK